MQRTWYHASLLLAVIATVRAAPGSTQVRAPLDSARDSLAAALAPGDAVELSFWREPQLNGDYPVEETGTVVLPILGERTVVHTSALELKRQLLDDYAKQLRNQEVRVTFLRRVRVLGAVKNPGLYRVDPTMTLGDAVALAGGVTHEGKLQSIRIIRNSRDVWSNLDSRASVVEYLRSGDQIVVPERSWFARNGPYVLAASISALGVIVARTVH